MASQPESQQPESQQMAPKAQMASTSGPLTRRVIGPLRTGALVAVVAVLIVMLVARLHTAQQVVSGTPGHGATAATGPAALSGPQPGRQAPDFTVHTWAWWDQHAPQAQSVSPAVQAAETVHLAVLAGRPVVVNFWASWCDACRAEAPTFETAWQRYRVQGVMFVGIDVNDTEQDSEVFMRQFGITYFNAPDATETIAVDYAVPGLPTTVFINGQGRVASKHIGALDAATLHDSIMALLR